MTLRPLASVTATAGGLLVLGGAAVTLATSAHAAPRPSPTTSASPAAASSSAPAVPSVSATPVPTSTALPTAAVPAPSTSAGGIDVPAGRVSITHRGADPTLPLALGGAGVLLVAGGATAAVRRRR